MIYRPLLSAVLACGVCLMTGCGDEPEQQPPVDPAPENAAAAAKLEEAARRLEEAERKLAQASEQLADQPIAPVEPVAYVPPPDHIAPFDMKFGFGNPDEVDHFWRQNQSWQFSEDQARNDKWKSGSVFGFNYTLSGDFKVLIKGSMSRSYTNSRRPKLQICGQEILLKHSTGKGGLDFSAERLGNKLYCTLMPHEPVVVELTEEQAGPTQVRLVFYNRHLTIKEFALSAEEADRMSFE